MHIDAHQHFWYYDPAQHVWMTDRMTSLKRDFLPSDLAPLLERAGFHGTVAVQARQNLEETEWLLELYDLHDFIKAVVGWVDLQSPAAAEQLERFAAHPGLRGVRHVVHDEPDDRFMLRPAFLDGLSLLADLDLTYDLLLFPRHVPVAVEVVRRFPEQKFVLDHIAKPDIAKGRFSPWDRDLRELVSFPNVFCKLSGMVTEASWTDWKYENFLPALDTVFDAFGIDRLMVGSDWPVCTLAGSYEAVMGIVTRYLASFPEAEREKVLGGNARRFYGIEKD